MADLDDVLARARGAGPIVFLTGAGISAESGIPTFRGPEEYWTVGSQSYHPTELATHAAFEAMPDEVWAWYLHRRRICRAAAPNRAHLALVALEERLGDDFLLVTQNVDGLHLRAGSRRIYQIHGNIDFMRCDAECSPEIVPIPDADPGATGGLDEPPSAGRSGSTGPLVCARCGGRARPHVLWFDESYDEERFRFTSSLRAADAARLLVVVGTSGATNLPTEMVDRAARRRTPLVVVDLERTAYAEVADLFIRAPAGVTVEKIARALGATW